MPVTVLNRVVYQFPGPFLKGDSRFAGGARFSGTAAIQVTVKRAAFGVDGLFARRILPRWRDTLDKNPPTGGVFFQKKQRVIADIGQFVIGVIDSPPRNAAPKSQDIQQIMIFFDEFVVGVRVFLVAAQMRRDFEVGQ